MARLMIARAPRAEDFDRGARPFFEYADLGLADATGGAFGAHVARATQRIGQGQGTGAHFHDADFQFIYVLRGRAVVDYEGHGPQELVAGTAIYQPRGLRHDVVEVSEDYEHLEIDMPAQFPTHPVARG